MDKVAKAVSKLNKKEKAAVKSIFLRLIHGDTQGLDIKKLKGYDSVFRVRRGKLRVLYRMYKGEVIIIKIGYRSEMTYRR